MSFNGQEWDSELSKELERNRRSAYRRRHEYWSDRFCWFYWILERMFGFLENRLGATPQGFESLTLRQKPCRISVLRGFLFSSAQSEWKCFTFSPPPAARKCKCLALGVNRIFPCGFGLDFQL